MRQSLPDGVARAKARRSRLDGSVLPSLRYLALDDDPLHAPDEASAEVQGTLGFNQRETAHPLAGDVRRDYLLLPSRCGGSFSRAERKGVNLAEFGITRDFKR